MSVERQTKEMFPKQRRLCKQRRSTVASIRSWRARRGVCGTCHVYGLYWCFGSVVRPFLSGATWSVYTLRRSNYICETQKTPTFFQTRALFFCCYSFGASSSAFTAAFGASASAAGASAFTSASAAGAAAVSSSTTDCCTNCSFSSAVRM